MCDGDFKEAHERRIVLSEVDSTDVGILIEYLYSSNFWVNGNPQTYMSKQDSAVKLAHLYILADKYMVEGMKEVTTKKIAQYTDVAALEDWLAVAEIIYAATPDSDFHYPKYLRSLVVHFMESEWKKSGEDSQIGAVRKGIGKGGRLAIDIYDAYGVYTARREAGFWDGWKQSGAYLLEEERKHDKEHGECRVCFECTYLGYPGMANRKKWGIYELASYDKGSIIDDDSWERDYSAEQK